MQFRKFVQELQHLLPVTEEEVHAGGELGVPDSEEHPSPEEVPAIVSEMAVASAPGVKLSRIKDEKYKDWDMSGYHNVTVDGEHAGVIDKVKGQYNSYKSSGYHYRVKPTLKGHMDPGSWKPLTDEEKAHVAAHPDGSHGYNLYNHHETGEPQRYTKDSVESDHKFADHDAHEHGFDSQQEAVDYLARAHRMAKQYPGGPTERYAEAHDVKERYLQGQEHANKARQVRNHLQQAAWAAKASYPDHPDLLKAIEDVHKHHAIADDGKQDEHREHFKNLTYDLPKHHWHTTEKDPHANLRDISKPWEV